MSNCCATELTPSQLSAYENKAQDHLDWNHSSLHK